MIYRRCFFEQKKFILIEGRNYEISCIDIINLHKDFNKLRYIHKEKKSKYLKNSYYKSISSDIISNIIQKNQKQL
jgi:hypothetical protein